jgi:N-succinyldiaminopimelate aminotransferase
MVDIAGLGFPDDVAFCRHLTTEVGVAAIPPSAFYHNPADGARLARFAFCKSEATLEAAASRLAKLR